MQKTYVGGMAEIAGSTPATGTYSYYATDNLGSPRAVYDGSKALAARFDYTPYCESYTANDTIGITHRYTGHDWDATAALYFAPYRFYNPQIARWMSRDPMGMVDGPNILAYVSGSPMRYTDRLGGQIMGPGPTINSQDTCKCIGEKAAGEAYQKYPRGRRNIEDCMRHCTWTCETTKKGGRRCANIVSDWHEYEALIWPGTGKEYDPFDFESNDAGMSCGADAPAASCDACCRNKCRAQVDRWLPYE